MMPRAEKSSKNERTYSHTAKDSLVRISILGKPLTVVSQLEYTFFQRNMQMKPIIMTGLLRRYALFVVIQVQKNNLQVSIMPLKEVSGDLNEGLTI